MGYMLMNYLDWLNLQNILVFMCSSVTKETE
jgi:hypothetical protein